jgi:hypothetical protein
MMNLKLQDGKPVKSGSLEPDLGCEEKYVPVCFVIDILFNWIFLC